MMRPARIATASGLNGESPAAMRSAFTNAGHSASSGRNSRAKVVLPAPFGPAMMMTRFRVGDTASLSRFGIDAGHVERVHASAKPPLSGRLIIDHDRWLR